MSKPNYTLQDIQLSVDDNEFDKGMQIFKNGKVGTIHETFSGFGAIVLGTEKYIVEVESKKFDYGDCNCYLGSKGSLCKHMLALAIAVVHTYRPKDMNIIDHPFNQAVCSGKISEATKQELIEIEEQIKTGLAYIKSWNGPSKKWFEYQDNLSKIIHF